MTFSTAIKEKKKTKISPLTLICLSLLPIMLYFSNGLKSGALTGIRLSLFTLIPTLFPFFILCDLWSCKFSISKDSAFGKIFQRIFGVSSAALPAFILGTVCGFPLGISLGAELYKSKAISKSELERLSGFANNPSCAFVISGIGAGLYGDVRLGILLYLSVILSAIIVGIGFRERVNFSQNTSFISRQSFSLIDSIKKAGSSSLAVACFVVFFSSIVGLTKELTDNLLIISLFSSLLEITNAASVTSSIGEELGFSAPIITAFALGFSGFSVHLQAFALLPSEISRTKYLLMKVTQGILCAIICLLFLLFT